MTDPTKRVASPRHDAIFCADVPMNATRQDAGKPTPTQNTKSRHETSLEAIRHDIGKPSSIVPKSILDAVLSVE